MRKTLVLAALANLLILGACNPATISAGLQIGAAVLPYITTDIQAALTSSKTLVAQAAADPVLAASPTVQARAATVQASISKVQAKIAAGAAITQATVNALNSATAPLLTAAAAAGSPLPGVSH